MGLKWERLWVLLPAGRWTTSVPGQAAQAVPPGSAGSRAEAQMPTQGLLQAAGSCPSPALASGTVQTHGHSASCPLRGSVSFPSPLFDSQVHQERLGIELKLDGRGLAHKSRASRELINSTKPGRRGRRPWENSQVPALRQSLHHPSATANPGCLQGACRDRGVRVPAFTCSCLDIPQILVYMVTSSLVLGNTPRGLFYRHNLRVHNYTPEECFLPYSCWSMAFVRFLAECLS